MNDGWYTPKKTDFIEDIVTIVTILVWIVLSIWFLFLVFT